MHKIKESSIQGVVLNSLEKCFSIFGENKKMIVLFSGFCLSVKMSTQEIMAELDEYKQNIPENLYLQLANLLKEKHLSLNKPKNVSNDGEAISVCLKIEYIPSIAEIFKKYVSKLPFEGWVVAIKEEDDDDDFDDNLWVIHNYIFDIVFGNLPSKAYEEL
jgi:hypothetical protein